MTLPMPTPMSVPMSASAATASPSKLIAALCATALGLALLAIAPSASAIKPTDPSPGGPLATTPSVEASIRKSLEVVFKDPKAITSIAPTPVAGIYEITVDRQVIYTDATGRFVIQGQILDIAAGQNLTKARLDQIAAADVIDFAALPTDLAIRYGPAKPINGRAIAVFEDPYCVYCRQFRQTLMGMKDLTVYVYLLPVIRPESVKTARDVWCSKDRATAWNDWMLGQKPPAAAPITCQFPQEKLEKLARDLRVRSTPISFVPSGVRLVGAMPADRVEEALAAAKR